MTDKKKKELHCGLIMPISAMNGYTAQHWDRVKNIFELSLQDSEFDVNLVSAADDVGVIQHRIVTNVYTTDIVICDVSGNNANVMFELGMRLAFDKPVVVVKDYDTNFSFDTSPLEHLQYPADLNFHDIVEFQRTLKDKVLATYQASKSKDFSPFLKHFGTFTIKGLDEHVVAKDDYLVGAVAQLQVDVASAINVLNQIASSPRSRSPAENGINIWRTTSNSTKKLVSPRDFFIHIVMSSLNPNKGILKTQKGRNDLAGKITNDYYDSISKTDLPMSVTLSNKPKVVSIFKNLLNEFYEFETLDNTPPT